MEYDIYDPSNTVDGGYWQMGHGSDLAINNQWRAVADLINQGLPLRENSLFRCTLPERDNELWGCLRRDGLFWMYRVYLTGRDNFARPGRYFFLLFKLDSPNGIQDQSITKIVRHMETQTAIPLSIHEMRCLLAKSPDPANLTTQIFTGSSAIRDTAGLLAGKCTAIPEGAHHGWIIKNGTIVRQYSDLPFQPTVVSEERPIPASIKTHPTVSAPSNGLKDFNSKRDTVLNHTLTLYVLFLISILAFLILSIRATARMNHLDAELQTLKTRILNLKDAETNALQTRQELDELTRRVDDYIRDSDPKKKKASTTPAVEVQVQPSSKQRP